jgi:MoxR-like ATPase
MSHDNGFPFYQGGRRTDRAKGLAALPKSPFLTVCRPESYLPDPGLVDAVNVALMLGQPLLVTGEPGTGKTQLANSISWDLGLGPCLKFETKSSSTSRDLFYIYNSLGRFHAAQTGTGSQDNRDYITYNALGEAVLRTHKPEEVMRFARPVHEVPHRSVVLIDEIDKAPRDFPNDILNEIEEMYFRVPELDNLEIRADSNFRPIVIITSNSEKHLPDAFLRRCIYYHIQFPDRQRLEEIVLAHLADVMSLETSFLTEALDLFMSLRSSTTSLHKKPATAELLGWIVAMDRFRTMDGLPRNRFDELAVKTLGSLTKTSEDREAAYKVIEAWRDEPRSTSHE